MNENPKLKTLKRMLRELSSMAEESSLTGSLQDAAPQFVRRYNSMLSQAAALGVVDMAFFEPLEGSATMAMVAVDARLLGAALEGEGDDMPRFEGDHEPPQDPHTLIRIAPFVDPEDLGKLVLAEAEKGAHISLDLVAALGPFLPRNVVGKVMEAAMRNGGGRRRPPEPPEAPQPPEPPESPFPVRSNQPWNESLPDFPRPGSSEG